LKTDFELEGNINTINAARDLDLEIKENLKPVLNVESQSRNEKGETIWLSTSKAPVLDYKGNFDGVVGVISDITSLKKMYEELDFAACYDKLTMLPNRNFFIKSLENFISRDENKWREFSVLYIGIDKFNLINETMGYAAGDELLRVVAFRINKVLNMESLVSRISGDEFAVALNVKEYNKLNSICRKILNSIKKAWEYENEHYYLTASIGIALFPIDGEDIEIILKNSHAALGQAKMNGIDSYCYYSEELGDYILKKLNIENDLRLAIEKNEFVLYYQPQVELKTNKIIGVEALIRWNHPQKGMIPPGVFIPIAEESGQIIQIGEWVIEESCKQIREWINKGIEGLKVSINVSAKQFESDVVSKIKEEIIKNDIGFNSLEVEVTESILMKDKDITLKKLNLLKSLGINILLDDFGTGYSSLLYLKTFPIDKIKIDQNFIKGFNKNDDTLTIVKIIIILANELGIKAIAEGVEFEEQYEKLLELGCEEIQGFLFGKPSLPEVIENLIRIDQTA
jgi:diguanylate cyclase (GGDEF)-like protein